MNTPVRNNLCATAAGLLLALTTGPAHAAESTLRFADSSQPGTLVVNVAFGDVVINGADTDEVKIVSDEPVQGGKPEERSDGLRRLDSDGGFLAQESGNVITLNVGNIFMGGRHGGNGDDNDVEVTVPQNTNVKLQRMSVGDATISDISGDIEVRGAVGDVELQRVSGGVLVESANGDVEADFVRLPDAKPVSITVVHGDVDVRVPADARANVRMRALHGEMLTDFSKDELQTSFQNATMVSVGRDAEKMAEKAAAEHDRAMAERDRALAEAERAMAEAEARRRETAAAPPAPPATATMRVGDIEMVAPVPPVPPVPPLPPMAGGKLVSGTLNGGGIDLIITTVTGDITLRKAE